MMAGVWGSALTISAPASSLTPCGGSISWPCVLIRSATSDGVKTSPVALSRYSGQQMGLPDHMTLVTP